MKKFLKIFSINFIILIIVLFISDVCIYTYNAVNYKKTHNSAYIMPPFRYRLFPGNFGLNLDNYFNGENNVYRGRKPDGLEYKDAKPLVIFGCSYAHGQFLNYNQTLSYKLSHALKRPVYNRAIPGRGLQHMYYQVTNPSFYRDVPPTDDFMYVFLGDHYRRMRIFYVDIMDEHRNVHYSIKKDKLVPDNPNNIFLTLLKSSYTAKLLNYKYTKAYLDNPKNADKITDDAVLYLTETRRTLRLKLKRHINFTVFIYDNFGVPYKDMFVEKLKKKKFKVISLDDITDEDFCAEKYLSPENDHPTEAAWDYIVPKIEEIIKNDN